MLAGGAHMIDGTTGSPRWRRRLRVLAVFTALGVLVAIYGLSATSTLLVGVCESFIAPDAPAECKAWRGWYVASLALPLATVGLFVSSFIAKRHG